MTLLVDFGGGTALTLDRDALPANRRSPGAPQRTLDDVLSEAWEGLLASAPVACPVCGSAMAPRWSAGAGVVGGRCGNCDSELG